MGAGASTQISGASSEDLQKAAAALSDDEKKKVLDALAASSTGGGSGGGGVTEGAKPTLPDLEAEFAEEAMQLRQRAKAAIDKLRPKDFPELNVNLNPPRPIRYVCEAVMLLMAGVTSGVARNSTNNWNDFCRLQNQAPDFIAQLREFMDKFDEVPQENIDRARQVIANVEKKNLSPEALKKPKNPFSSLA